ncbi:laccase-2-like [Gossypium australe]|uniref:Laccase-2-like n=1 Tax=Gossypium australe TaxID=47621 RepID=A0A5B6WPP7_9ROSI|nr:laccase-2-like [Gossypium australe]
MYGYSSCKKGYIIFYPFTSKVFESRDVRFNEEALWNWEATEAEMSELNVRTDEIQNQDADYFDDLPVRGTRPVSEVYERCNIVKLEPTSYEEAKKENGWIEAMEAEIAMIKKNETWELIERQVCKKVTGVKWVYKTKLNVDGSMNRLKSRLVAKGFSQQYGVDYAKTFTPVARLH